MSDIELTVEKHVTNGHPYRNDGYAIVDPKVPIKIAYEIWKPVDHAPSKNQANIYFLHGAQLSKEVWRYHIRLLYNLLGRKLGICVAIDSASHGDSYLHNKNNITFHLPYSDCAKDTLAVVKDTLQPGRTILLGHSMGAAVANYAAFLEPSLIDSVVSFDPVIYIPKIATEDPSYNDGFKVRMLKLRAVIQDKFKDEEAMSKFMRTRGVTASFHPKVKKDVLDHAFLPRSSDSDPYVMKVPKIAQVSGYANATEAYQFGRYIVRCIPHHVLHIVGSILDWQSKEAIEGYRNDLRFVTSVTVPNAGHNAPYQKPEECMGHVAEFVKNRLAINVEEKPLSVEDGFKDVIATLAANKFGIYSKL